MSSISTQRLLIVYSDLILQKKRFFPHVRHFALVVVLLLIKFMAHLASFDSKLCFFSSNTLSIVKVMPKNLNLTMFDMLTLSCSNMTAPTLKTNEHLKKQTNHVFILILLTPN